MVCHIKNRNLRKLLNLPTSADVIDPPDLHCFPLTFIWMVTLLAIIVASYGTATNPNEFVLSPYRLDLYASGRCVGNNVYGTSNITIGTAIDFNSRDPVIAGFHIYTKDDRELRLQLFESDTTFIDRVIGPSFSYFPLDCNGRPCYKVNTKLVPSTIPDETLTRLEIITGGAFFSYTGSDWGYNMSQYSSEIDVQFDKSRICFEERRKSFASLAGDFMGSFWAIWSLQSIIIKLFFRKELEYAHKEETLEMVKQHEELKNGDKRCETFRQNSGVCKGKDEVMIKF